MKQDNRTSGQGRFDPRKSDYWIAHTNAAGEEQLIIDHVRNVADLAASFASAFGNGDFAYYCGLLHDLGKFSVSFQKRIRNMGGRCDHSTFGARLLYKNHPTFGMLGAYCISGHHGGLRNAGSRTDTGGEGTLYGRLSDENEIPACYGYENDLEEVLKQIPNLRIQLKPMGKGCGFSFSFFIRMIYSALVDADYLDTERFIDGEKRARKSEYDFKKYLKQLNGKLAEFKVKNDIDQTRKAVLDQCIAAAPGRRGLYSLTVPTGGGKTLSSMAFAINHLLENNMDRIIYVIPFTSIIEQTAKIFKEIFGEKNVLEHHSNFVSGDGKIDDDETFEGHRLSAENWDAPIIITTNVQFFESLFTNKSSKSRKLHNISNSVIIFDEVQMLPEQYLMPCIMSIAELVQNYRSTAILCSATQPAIAPLFPQEITNREIYPDIDSLYSVLSRTQLALRGTLHCEQLGAEINTYDRCLCIVNTRKHAVELFKVLKGEGCYHLSTLMFPKHRKHILEEIKRRLSNSEACKVVATRLIEAGVDVDFPVVYRSICGLDSMIQAAGRCNREGELRDVHGESIKGMVYVFTPEERFSKYQPDDFKRQISIAKQTMEQYEFEDLLSPRAIAAYFTDLHEKDGEVGRDVKSIYKRLEIGVSGCKKTGRMRYEFDFEQIAKDFKLIEENTIPIIIPYDEVADSMIAELEEQELYGGILRDLQQYSVNLYERDFNRLLNAGKLRKVKAEVHILIDPAADYDKNTGLKIPEEEGVDIYL